MTMQNRSFISPSDVIALEIECAACRMRMTYLASSEGELPKVCPSCSKELFPRDGNWTAVKELKTALEDVVRRKLNNIRLEVTTPLS